MTYEQADIMGRWRAIEVRIFFFEAYVHKCAYFNEMKFEKTKTNEWKNHETVFSIYHRWIGY